MRHGQHYDQTYAPVASWNYIRTLLIMSTLKKWNTHQIDFFIAFPQAPVEREIHIDIPKGFQIKGGNTKDYMLQLHRNIYDKKQSGRVQNTYLANILVNKVGFKHSNVEKCVFYCGNAMYVQYTDYSILAVPNPKDINQDIKYIRAANINIIDEGDVQDFLQLNIDRKPDSTINITQPHLNDQILDDLKMGENTKPKETNASS